MFAGDPNFATLEGEEQYRRYFGQLSSIFQVLIAGYEQRGAGTAVERRVVADLLGRLLGTMEVLRMKYGCVGELCRPLLVDLTESGFPNHAELAALQADQRQRENLLAATPTLGLLKREYLDHLFEDKVEPRGILSSLCERASLEMLVPEKVYLPFTLGSIEQRSRAGGEMDRVRGYLASWGSYDFTSNRPYLHLMSFEQDGDRPPLDVPGPERDALIRVLEHEGTRTSDVGLMAAAIDDTLESIHPKIVKRICIGPLYSRSLLDGRPENANDRREWAIRRLFERSRVRDDDLMLFVTDEIVFSKRQEIGRSLFSPAGKVREIFLIPESDPEAYERRASVVHHTVLLPHLMLQLVNEAEDIVIPGFDDCTTITFDERGTVHGI